MNLKLKRLVRTTSSEEYALFDLDQVTAENVPMTIGKLDLHYTGEGVYGTILLWDEASRGLTAAQRRGFIRDPDAGAVSGGSVAPAANLAPQPTDRVVVLVGHAFLERDDGVVGDLDVLGTDLGAALVDVAVADAAVVLQLLLAVSLVERMHLQAGRSHQEARPEELELGLVVAQDVAGVHAQEALDALAELLAPLAVLLLPAPFGLRLVGRREGRDELVDLVVPGHVGDEVTHAREGAHGLDRDGFALREVRQSRLAHERRLAVDLGGAAAALGRLAVPARGQVGLDVLLDPVDGVEDDHALPRRHDVLEELALLVAFGPVDPELRFVSHA